MANSLKLEKRTNMTVADGRLGDEPYKDRTSRKRDNVNELLLYAHGLNLNTRKFYAALGDKVQHRAQMTCVLLLAITQTQLSSWTGG